MTSTFRAIIRSVFDIWQSIFFFLRRMDNTIHMSTSRETPLFRDTNGKPMLLATHPVSAKLARDNSINRAMLKVNLDSVLQTKNSTADATNCETLCRARPLLLLICQTNGRRFWFESQDRINYTLLLMGGSISRRERPSPHLQIFGRQLGGANYPLTF